MKSSHSSYFSLPRAILSGVLTIFGATLLLVLIVRGESIEDPRDESTLIILDHSLSMAVEDMKIEGTTSLSRLDFAKSMILQNTRENDRIGIIKYAKNPSLLFPISPYSSERTKLIESIIPEDEIGGSDLPIALSFAKNLYGEKNLSVLVFTDGGSTSTSEFPKIPRNWRITISGIGSEAGGKIPLGYNANSERRYKYYSGSEVIVAYEGASLEENADRIGATYVHLTEKIGTSPSFLSSFLDKNWPFALALFSLLAGTLLHPYVRKN